MAKRTCDPTSGSIGTETYLIGRHGQVVRDRVTPANPRTSPQTMQRSILATVAARWRTLTDGQRTAWASAATSHQTKPRLGTSGPLTGEQLFCRINAVLQTFGLDQADVPPAYPVFPSLAPQGLVITNTAGTIAIKLTCPTNPGDNTVLRASAPCSAGIARTPRQVLIGTVPTPIAESSNITSLYVARYGVPGVASRLFVTCNMFTDGWESQLVTFTAVVPAA
jgi:hypothetical protein